MTSPPSRFAFLLAFLTRGLGDDDGLVDSVTPGLEGVPSALPLRVCMPALGADREGTDVIICYGHELV